MATIRKKYSMLDAGSDEDDLKQSILLFLHDELFVQSVLDYFSISTLELFKMLCARHGALMKGPYLKKVKLAIAGKPYAQSIFRS